MGGDRGHPRFPGARKWLATSARKCGMRNSERGMGKEKWQLTNAGWQMTKAGWRMGITNAATKRATHVSRVPESGWPLPPSVMSRFPSSPPAISVMSRFPSLKLNPNLSGLPPTLHILPDAAMAPPLALAGGALPVAADILVGLIAPRASGLGELISVYQN